MSSYCLILAVLLLLHAPHCKATVGKDSSRCTEGQHVLDVVYQDIRVAGEDGLGFFLSPLSFGAEECLLAGAVLAGTASLFLADEHVRDFARRNRHSTADNIASYSNEGGRLIWAGTLIGALYVTGLAAGSDELRVTGRLLGQSLVYSSVLAMAFRVALGRERPHSGESSTSFRGWQWKNEFQSLPSGHTTIAFSLASVLSRRISHPAATVLLYSAAASTALARVYDDEHWVSDVFLAAAIGHVAGMFVCSREEKRSMKQGANSLTWTILPRYDGIFLQLQF